MARYTSKAGYGLQLWDVKRLRVELYASWPQDTPNEVWGPEVLDYDLPLGALNNCLAATLQIVADPKRPTLPAGIVQDTSLPGKPLRMTLTAGERLALVVATLPGGDEWVVYTGLLGAIEPTDGRHWKVDLIDPAEMGLPLYPKNNSMSGANPTALAAVADASAPSTTTSGTTTSAYGSTGTSTNSSSTTYVPVTGTPVSTAAARFYGNYSVSGDDFTPKTTNREWWAKAMEAYPDATFGCGPDLVFTAGISDSAPVAIYNIDQRAVGLTCEGRTVRDYLTLVRRSIEGWGTQDIGRTGTPLPRFLPPRTASIGGQVSTEVQPTSGTLSISGSGAAPVSGKASSSATVAAAIGQVPPNVRLTGMSMIGSAVVSGVAGRVKLTAQAYMVGKSGWAEVGNDSQEITVGDHWTYNVQPEPAKLVGAASVGLMVTITGMTDDAHAVLNLSAISATYAGEYDQQNVAFDPVPPGLATPPITDDTWTFKLRGIHAGIRCGGLPGGTRPCTTRIRVNRQVGVYTEVHAGALPSRG